MTSLSVPPSMMSPAKVIALVGEYMGPCVVKAMAKIQTWAEDPQEVASASDMPDNGRRRPDPAEFKATLGLPWLKAGHLCKLYGFDADGVGAAVRPMLVQGWVRDVRECCPSQDEIAFRFTEAGAEVFADLAYPDQRLAHHRALTTATLPVPKRRPARPRT